jgi:hypothetical protein
MSIQLMPLIESRPLTITAAAFGDGRIRDNVVPRALAKDGKLNENLENRPHRRATLLMQREGPNLLPVLKIAHFVYRPVRGSSFAYAP